MQGDRPSTAGPPGDAVQDRLVIPELHSISVMNGMLLVLQPVIFSRSFAS